MAYMVYQQYTNAIVDAYAGHPDVPANLEAATAHREWLESLDIVERRYPSESPVRSRPDGGPSQAR